MDMLVIRLEHRALEREAARDRQEAVHDRYPKYEAGSNERVYSGLEHRKRAGHDTEHDTEKHAACVPHENPSRGKIVEEKSEACAHKGQRRKEQRRIADDNGHRRKRR